ncbi:alpha/beta hydrolase, partial [Rhizobium ruizarguesonis]
DLEARFGKTFRPEDLAKVPVHMIVSDADLETWEITHKPGGKYYMDGANDAGKTRPEHLAALASSFRKAGVDVTFDRVPGVS